MFSIKTKKMEQTYVKKKIEKLLVIFIILCIQLVACGEPENKEERTVELMDTMELQPDEIEILSDMYVNDEKIKTGKLFSYQKDNLERYRFAKKYLSEKYPDYSFEIKYGEPKSKFMPQAEFTFISKEDEEKNYKLCVYNMEDSNEYYAEDNFYEAIFADKYDEYIRNIIEGEVINVSAVISSMPWTKGKEYGINMKVEDVTSGKMELSANTAIYITDSDMTESAFSETVEKIRNRIQDNNFYGSFKVYVYDDNVSPEEVIKEEGNVPDYLFKDTFQNFREE